MSAPSEALSAGSEVHTEAAASAKVPSKSEVVLALLRRPEGATLDQMVTATGWLPHTTRAVLTGFKKKGHSITSEKVDGVRTYRATQTRGDQAPSMAADPAESEAASGA